MFMTRLFRIGDVFDSILVFIYNLIIECTCDSPVFMISVAFYRSEDPVAPGGGQQDCEVDGNNKLRNEDLVCGGKFSQKHLIHNNYMTACYMYMTINLLGLAHVIGLHYLCRTQYYTLLYT